MRSHITSLSPKVVITNDSFIFINNASLHNSGQHIGDVIYFNGDMYVWDDSGWTMIQTDHSVSLDPDAEMAIDWAMKKMQEEAALEQMCEEFPALAKARDQFEMIKALVEHNYKKE